MCRLLKVLQSAKCFVSGDSDEARRLPVFRYILNVVAKAKCDTRLSE